MHASVTQSRRAAVLLWLAGSTLRLTILAVPPVLAIIQTDLKLTGTQVGILTSLPVVMMGLAAVPGSLMIARFGALSALMIGMVLTALGGALRGVAFEVWTLFAATVVMGAGVAVMQPAMPSLVRQWLPHRIGFGSAVFTNGLLIGEVLPVALTVPLLLGAWGLGWHGGLAFWSLPTLAIAAVVFWFAPRVSSAAPVAAPVRWWPDWCSVLTWRLSLVFSAANSLYFGINAFVPGYLSAAGHPDLIAPTLTALNAGQIPSSILLLMFATRIERRVWPFMLAGIATLAALAALLATASLWTVFFAGVCGFTIATLFTLGLALPATLCAPEDVGRMAAAMFTVGYGLGVVLSVAGGALWDLTGDVRFAFLPMALGALPLLLLAPSLRFPRIGSDIKGST
jgi:CP family cyanate transporter-like MFS transporter